MFLIPVKQSVALNYTDLSKASLEDLFLYPKAIDKTLSIDYTDFKIRKLIGAGRKTQVHLMAGKFLAFLIFHGGKHGMELSVFIDESGDFGEYDNRSPFYIIAMVFHEQNSPISNDISHLDQELAYLGLNHLCIHTGPIVRREEIYEYMSITDRRRIFNKLVAFFRQIDIRYKCIYTEKKQVDDVIQLTSRLSKKMSRFILDNYEYFLSCEAVKIYYDNGQIEVSRILASVFSALIPSAEFKKVLPKDYKLFQIADLVCTMELIRLKVENGSYSTSEELFFGSQYELKRNYLRIIQRKEWKESRSR